MFNLIKFIAIRPEATPAERTALLEVLETAPQRNPQVLSARLHSTLPGSHSSADLIWRVQFADEGAYRACLRTGEWLQVERALAAAIVSHIDSAAYMEEAQGLTEPGMKGGLYRALLIRRRPGISAEKIAQYENEQREMALYMPAIQNWALSRVVEGSVARQWDYVWEQEFQAYEPWLTSYMLHPYHWARIHRWFDPESPDWIHEPWYALSVSGFEHSILATKA
jgi:hypothetical protein